MSPAPAPFWPIAGAGLVFLLAGAAIAAWPRPLIHFYIRLLRPMRRLFGRSLIDWEIGLLERRAAPIFVRLFGLFVVVAGASIFLFRLSA